MGFLLGAGYLGRDLLAGIVHGVRVTPAIGLSAAVPAVVAGITVGALPGYHEGAAWRRGRRHGLRTGRRNATVRLYSRSLRTEVIVPNGSAFRSRSYAFRSPFRCRSSHAFAYQSRITWGRYTSPSAPAVAQPSWV